MLAGFFQDDWKVGRNLTVNLGLRYDVEIIKDIPDWPAGTDANNLDPRVGFAWDPNGDQKWAIRGGFGRFTQQHAIFTIVKGGVGGRNGQVTVNLTPADALFPTFPNALPAFPPGAVIPARSIQEISPDLENEHAWQASIGFQRQIGARTSVAVDANMNRGVKHGFLDMNAPDPIPKDVLNAALARQSECRRPHRWHRPTHAADQAGPNGFRHMDVLTNEGRSWYQGVRFSVIHRTTPLRPDRVVHALEGRRSAQSLVLAGEQPGSRIRPRPDWRRHAAQPRHQHQLERARQRACPQRLAPQHGVAPPERLAVHDPLRRRPVGYSVGLNAACNSRGCQPSTPGGRNTARGMFINYADLTLARQIAIGTDHIEVRADVFNVFNNQNLLAGGYINLVGNPRFGQHTGGSGVLPGRQFQFAATYRF